MMRAATRCFATVLIVMAATGAQADPVCWEVSSGGNGHYYTIVDQTMDWYQARDLAGTMAWQGLTGHLVTITSQAEQAWVWSRFPGACNYWLGGYQMPGSPEPAGGWRWVTDEPWSYAYWNAGEPNNVNDGHEDFLEMSGRCEGTWYDVPIWSTNFGFVVEFDEMMPVAADSKSWSAVKADYLQEGAR